MQFDCKSIFHEQELNAWEIWTLQINKKKIDTVKNKISRHKNM